MEREKVSGALFGKAGCRKSRKSKRQRKSRIKLHTFLYSWEVGVSRPHLRGELRGRPPLRSRANCPTSGRIRLPDSAHLKSSKCQRPCGPTPNFFGLSSSLKSPVSNYFADSTRSRPSQPIHPILEPTFPHHSRTFPSMIAQSVDTPL